MVVIFFPAACETGARHERVSAPLTWTLQAPHSPAPQPNLVPVSSSVSRRTQSSGVSASTLTLFSVPLTFRVKFGMGRAGKYPKTKEGKREMVVPELNHGDRRQKLEPQRAQRSTEDSLWLSSVELRVLCGYRFLPVVTVDHPSDAVPEMENVEIDEQANLSATQSHIRKDLCLVDRIDRF